MAKRDNTKPALKRAKAKGYFYGDMKGPSDEWAAQSRMFYDEREKREKKAAEKSVGDLPSKRAANVKVGTVK